VTTRDVKAERADHDADVSAVVRQLAVLGDPAGWVAAPEYRSTALAAIDAIWSIGVRSSSVVNVIARYSALRAEQGADPEADTPADLVAFFDACGSAEEFARLVRNRQRTSSRGGILKAEALRRAAALLAGKRIETPTALRSLGRLERDELQTEWRRIPGQASGVSWDAFVMLSGMSGVKADRMIRRFVAEALGKREGEVTAARARELVIAASDVLGIEDRVTDFAIWEAMSSRSRPR
jgi:hypothetical protein